MSKKLLVFMAILLSICLFASCSELTGETGHNGVEPDIPANIDTPVTDPVPDDSESSDSVEDSSVSTETESGQASVTEDTTENVSDVTEESEPVSEQEIDVGPYSAPRKTKEIYSPDDGREFRIYGVTYSDNDYSVVFGECAVGAVVTVTTADGEYSVQSIGGNFALRVYSPEKELEFNAVQSYDGNQIGEPVSWSGKIKKSSYYDDSWRTICGYDNQLFFNKMLPYFRNTNLMSDDKVDSIKKNITKRVGKLAAQVITLDDGTTVEKPCELIYVIAPSSITVYPELVPEQFEHGEGESKFDQAVAVLEESGATVIDLREAFIAHKNDIMPLYYKYDSHWAEYGAYIAYVELFNYISEKYPEAAPRRFDEFTWDSGYYTLGDFLYYLEIDEGGLIYEKSYVHSFNFEPVECVANFKRYKRDDGLAYRAYSDQVQRGAMYETGRDELPNMYVFRNSYGAQISDLIIERGNNTYLNTMFTFSFNLAQVLKKEPDYVIYIVSEWELDSILDN